MGLLYGRIGRLTTQNGGFRRGQCWADGFGPLTRKLRALLGPGMIIYTNECGGEFDPIHNNDTVMNITEIPPDFDLISLDVYADYMPPALPAENRSNEVAMAKPFYESLFSRMQPHQRAVLVPGTFACSNATTIGGKGVRAVVQSTLLCVCVCVLCCLWCC